MTDRYSALSRSRQQSSRTFHDDTASDITNSELVSAHPCTCRRACTYRNQCIVRLGKMHDASFVLRSHMAKYPFVTIPSLCPNWRKTAARRTLAHGKHSQGTICAISTDASKSRVTMSTDMVILTFARDVRFLWSVRLDVSGGLVRTWPTLPTSYCSEAICGRRYWCSPMEWIIQ